MKKGIRRIGLVLVLGMLLSCIGCFQPKPEHRPQLNTDFTTAEDPFSFAATPSPQLTLSDAQAAAVLNAVRQIQPVYPYAALYQLEEAQKRLDFDATVERHRFSALNASGQLDASHLAQLVLENNDTFLAAKPFGYKAVDPDYLAELCGFIVTVVRQMQQRYPDLDWARIYCNLGNLKILYDVGMLSYAQVSPEMILSISENNTGILLNMEGENGFSRVMTHEIMHILQIGCSCEQIEDCIRRAGIAVYWDSFRLNSTDWTWFVEGSAERQMCRLTGGDAVSYQYKMDYICSMTMSVLLREEVAADTMETLCFYSDPQLLFDAFGCVDAGQREELLNMMITLQVLQMQPGAFHDAYKEATGVDLREDTAQMDQFSYSLKPAVCVTLAKMFYENLIPFLLKNELTCNDLFFLLNLFEGHLNQHLRYTDEEKAQINQPFLEAYNAMRRALFAALETDNPQLPVGTLYAEYTITASDPHLLNAQLAMLPASKLAFLAERAGWQADLRGLGQKVPTT